MHPTVENLVLKMRQHIRVYKVAGDTEATIS